MPNGILPTSEEVMAEMNLLDPSRKMIRMHYTPGPEAGNLTAKEIAQMMIDAVADSKLMSSSGVKNTYNEAYNEIFPYTMDHDFHTEIELIEEGPKAGKYRFSIVHYTFKDL